MSFLSAKPMRASVGAEASSSPYLITHSFTSDGRAFIFSSKTTGFPVWGYIESYHDTKSFPGDQGLWLYFAQVGLPMFVNGQWTNVSKFVAQGADAADATMIATVDVSRGGVVQTGNTLYASDAFGISEVALFPTGKDWAPMMIRVKAAKGLAVSEFTPGDVYNSIAGPSGSGLGFVPQDSKGNPLPKPPPIPEPPPKTAPAAKPFPTGKWVVGGTIIGGLLWALGRKP